MIWKWITSLIPFVMGIAALALALDNPQILGGMQVGLLLVAGFFGLALLSVILLVIPAHTKAVRHTTKYEMEVKKYHEQYSGPKNLHNQYARVR